jgi:histidine triad (HIT) family protein
MVNECLFCKIVAGEISSDEVFSNDDFIVIKDANPKVEGHLLVIPKKHSDGVLDMDSKVSGKVLDVVKEVAQKEGIKDFNLIVNNGKVAGQIISHFHLHVLPRREGDGLILISSA